MNEFSYLEEDVRNRARRLGQLEKDRASEYLRLTQFELVKNWDASQRVDADYALAIRVAQGAYEIAVAALRRAK